MHVVWGREEKNMFFLFVKKKKKSFQEKDIYSVIEDEQGKNKLRVCVLSFEPLIRSVIGKIL